VHVDFYRERAVVGVCAGEVLDSLAAETYSATRVVKFLYTSRGTSSAPSPVYNSTADHLYW